MNTKTALEHHGAPATGVSVEQESMTVCSSLGSSLPQGTAAPAQHQVDLPRVVERARHHVNEELRAASGLTFERYMSFLRALVEKDRVGVAGDAIAANQATALAPQGTPSSSRERARQLVGEELRAISGLGVTHIASFESELDERDGAGAEQGTVPGLERARKLVRDELRTLNWSTFAPSASFLRALEDAGADDQAIEEATPTMPRHRLMPGLEGDKQARASRESAGGAMDEPSDAVRVVPANRALVQRRLSDPGSLTPSPPPRAVSDWKRARDDEGDDAADIAPSTKHRRMETDAAAGSSRPRAPPSSTEPTHATASISTMAAPAAVALDEDSLSTQHDSDAQPMAPPMLSVRGRRPTPFPYAEYNDDCFCTQEDEALPLQSTRDRMATPFPPPCIPPVPRAASVEALPDPVEVKEEPEDDMQLLSVRDSVPLDDKVQAVQDDDTALRS